MRVSVENYDGVMPLTLAAGGGNALIVKKLLKSRGMRLLSDHAEKAVVAAVEKDKFDCAKMILVEFQASTVLLDPGTMSLGPHSSVICDSSNFSITKTESHLVPII